VIHLECPCDNFGFVLARQFVRIFERQGKPGLFEAATGVLFELHAQRRHDVEGGMEVGEFAEDFDHAPVIFQGMQTRPREHVTPVFGVAVLRLMHVPQHDQMNPLHCSRLSRASPVTGRCPANS